jgi:hypothetical protein
LSTLSQIRDRVEATLMDVANAIWDTATLDESLRQCLDEYTAVFPLMSETVIVLPGDGREIAIESLAGMLEVLEVWWPYDSDAATEAWPPNRVRGFRVYWDDARPVLFLDLVGGDQPQQDDEVRIWYAKAQTIQDLDSAAVTTVLTSHESQLVKGAAGHAALSRMADLIEDGSIDLYGVGLLATWGRTREREWASFLEGLRRQSARRGVPWGSGWALDKWDSGR